MNTEVIAEAARATLTDVWIKEQTFMYLYCA